MFMVISLSTFLYSLFFIYPNSYGASDGYPSQDGITKDAQVCLLVNYICLHMQLSMKIFLILYLVLFVRLLWIIFHKELTLIHLE